ncbi:hypothetical protein GCM10007304_37550 [Rhodococcoides trifolii]|uniref:Glycosyltransferase subfamily 4-like N-terminal domain-containing protein n=1 Tax=Rhodococcoides trifolii TaxID=908250 RepID=A0A917G2N5_9NOCA|nr:hypothetical protein [Rhodococcus trifolii]GGG20151.1 hypothetical protein GCM10007304_37550 [Rhodococcus trifolii]
MITVASIPHAHVYVTGSIPAGDSVRVLTDPAPSVDAPAGQWWPPRFLEPEYLATRIHEIDVLHIHFGFEHFTPAQLTDVVELLGRHGTALVLTVHDLHNPHVADNTEHRRRLDVLVPAADVVLTLTEGAAREIEQTWNVSAIVVPHPHIVPLELVGAARPVRDRAVVGIHAKSLRANLDPESVLPAVIAAAASVDADVRLDIDDNMFDPSSHAYAPDAAERLLAFRRFPNVDVRVHARFDDDQFVDYLSDIDVSVLPYRFGTHSGWMEACRDVGTRVVAPSLGHYRDQFDCDTYEFGDDDSVRAAVVAAVAAASAPFDGTALRRERTAEQAAVRATHEAVYTSVATMAVSA